MQNELFLRGMVLIRLAVCERNIVLFRASFQPYDIYRMKRQPVFD